MTALLVSYFCSVEEENLVSVGIQTHNLGSGILCTLPGITGNTDSFPRLTNIHKSTFQMISYVPSKL